MATSEGWHFLPSGRLITAVLLVLFGYRLFRIINNLFIHPLAKIPGPRAWSASRLPLAWGIIKGSMLHDIQELHRKYGPVVRIAPNEVSFASEESWREILQHQPHQHQQQQFLKDSVWWGNQPGLPTSIVTAIEPEKHGRIRKIILPGFSASALRDQERAIQLYVNLLVDRLRDVIAEQQQQRKKTSSKEGEEKEKEKEEAATIDIVPWLNFTTFDIFGDLGFGEPFNCLLHAKYHPWIALLFNSMKVAAFVAAARLYPVGEFILLKCIPPTLRKMQMDHYQQIDDRVHRRINMEVKHPDIMSHVMRGIGQHDVPMSEISSTFMILTIAGSETTATTLSGTINYLVNNPDKLEALAREVRGQFASLEDITLDGLRTLPYLDAVLREGLRLCPPIPFMLPRRVPTSVAIQAYTMNRDPAHFHEPDSFLPERWLPGSNDAPDSPFRDDRRQAMQAFSLGPRSCVGQPLAWAELRLIVSKLVWAFDMEAVAEREKRVRWEDLRVFVLVEKRPIEIRMRARAVE
ncbi:Cytochrome P450 monooxygenase lcsI [Cladobotryum mycophilum]|uniref:Cytochrome P450 monooxygenase lcsI n=1 Tax=Cladobotryum mycophilum TaxID=491253 RepID=A0ABR0SI11_9HYPO